MALIADLSPATLLLALVVSYVFISTIYYLFFHPLAKVPGPWLSKISRLPSFYHAIQGDRHIWIWQLHQIYGDKVRIEPNAVLFSTPQAFRDIYGSKAAVKRAKAYEAWARNVHEPNTALTIDPAAHARKRRILNQAFTDKTVKHAAGFICRHADRWIELLTNGDDGPAKDGWSKSRNMAEWNSWVVFDILGDLCFGRSFEIKEKGVNPIRKIPHMITQHVQFFYPILQSPWMEFFVWAKPRGLDWLFDLITPKEFQEYYKFVDDNVEKRLKEEADKKDEEKSRLDFFHFLCAAKDSVTGKRVSEDELRAEGMMLIVAGSDSIIAVLAGFWFYLSRNERAYKKLTTEIRSTFSTSDEITSGPKLSSCVYLHACIDEALRISPASPSEGPREVLPGGTTIDGEHFPQGIVVGCAHWVMGHSEQVFGDPNRFRPERYIPSEATGVTVEEVNRLKSSYQPFSTGPNKCVGKNIAISELALLIAKTLFQLDLRAAPGENLGAGHPSLGWGKRDEQAYQIIDAFITVADGPVLQFRKREV